MAEEGGAWKLWRHTQDHSVLYEVREWPEWPDVYECKRPGTRDKEAWFMPKASFEEVYEPVPEEEISG